MSPCSASWWIVIEQVRGILARRGGVFFFFFFPHSRSLFFQLTFVPREAIAIYRVFSHSKYREHFFTDGPLPLAFPCLPPQGRGERHRTTGSSRKKPFLLLPRDGSNLSRMAIVVRRDCRGQGFFPVGIRKRFPFPPVRGPGVSLYLV